MDNLKITIVGLLPMQANLIRNAYGDDVDLRFVTGEAISRAQTTAASSDHVVLMTKFTPHDVQTALRKHDLVFCNGGVSSLKLTLDAILTSL